MRHRHVVVSGAVVLLTAISIFGVTFAAAQRERSNSPTAAKLSVPVPKEVLKRGKLVVAVKCDYPPWGYTDASGHIVGYEIDMAKHMATYAFGKPKIQLVCATVAARIGDLQTNKVDLVDATFSITQPRAKVVGFSTPYFAAGGEFLALKGHQFNQLSQLAGKPVAMVTGVPWVDWVTKCIPNVHEDLFPTSDEAVNAVGTGRDEVYLEDQSFLVYVAATHNQFIVTGPNLKQLGTAWGLGVRKNDKAMKAWANAAILKMQKEDYFWKLLKKWLPHQVLGVLKSAIRRPGFTPNYHQWVGSFSNAPLACGK